MNRGGLGEEALASYRERGYHFPIPVMGQAEADSLRVRYLECADRLSGRNNQKPHLLFPWLNALVRDPRILDAVESVLGPDLLCWSSQFFAKPSGDPSYVSWHQDGTYWGLSSPDVITAWLAFTPSTPESGCMRVIAGTHREIVRHEDRFAADNMLSRGQEIAVRVDLEQAVDLVLQPGEMSLHHVLIFHGSEPNRSSWPRIGYAIRYIPTHVHQTSAQARESATLVRGTDRFGHFDPEPAPEAEMHPRAVAAHAEIVDRQLRILYAGAKQRGHLGPADPPGADRQPVRP
ncbi:MAG: phytanoyl-CoA dioxygenase family protein [Burkholderiaceae bacterium]|nr:phytanoyl-CoA dioxygenase family protein [Burkholderiaceae bacterium]